MIPKARGLIPKTETICCICRKKFAYYQEDFNEPNICLCCDRSVCNSCKLIAVTMDIDEKNITLCPDCNIKPIQKKELPNFTVKAYCAGLSTNDDRSVMHSECDNCACRIKS
jgi:hypothetical protein